MADTTANEPIDTYDEWAPSAIGDSKPGRPATHHDYDGPFAFRLEIVLVSGREGEKLQAIQARAIRDALLWAAQHEDNGNSPEEDGHDRRDDRRDVRFWA